MLRKTMFAQYPWEKLDITPNDSVQVVKNEKLTVLRGSGHSSIELVVEGVLRLSISQFGVRVRNNEIHAPLMANPGCE